ncbi:MAG: hypothetical protein P4L74_02400 [Candidatus Doudnabacteria bacterium]|nr:hypothetical protein [Candidatus Doudnabacteria bacterium]
MKQKEYNIFFMKLILIDGGPASGKNTLGKILVEDFIAHGKKSILLDLDTYIEKFCPTWIWDNDHQKEDDLLKARADFTSDLNKFLAEGFIVIGIGDRFLIKEGVLRYSSKVTKKVPVYLYHLNVPFALRKRRLEQRGRHSLIDLYKDQQDRDKIESWPGYVYQNINSPEVDAAELEKLIDTDQGLLNI